MTRTQGAQSPDDPAIPSPPDQSTTRPDLELKVRPSLGGLVRDLAITGVAAVCLTWNPAAPWWIGIPVGAGCAALFYALRRSARALADAQSAANMAKIYASTAAGVVPPRWRLSPAPWFDQVGRREEKKIKAALDASVDALLKNFNQHDRYGAPLIASAKLWRASFVDGPLRDADEVVTFPEDPVGLPPLAYVHDLDEPLGLAPFGKRLPRRTYYRLTGLNEKTRFAAYEEVPDGFTVTDEDYERMRRKLAGES